MTALSFKEFYREMSLLQPAIRRIAPRQNPCDPLAPTLLSWRKCHLNATYYRAAMEAFRKANEAFERGPKPGTPEWSEWQRLLSAAVAANDEFVREVERQSANTSPLRQDKL
jgi:hypothetical protein